MNEELKKIELDKIQPEKKLSKKAELLNDKIEQWFHNAIRNKGIPTESYNSILKSKDALKASLLELIN
jgi:hypothetical protein